MNTESRQWYQEPWVLGVIAIPFSAVLFGIVMIVAAGIYRDDVVVDEYYKDGMSINRELALRKAAAGIEAAFRIEDGQVIAELEGTTEDALVLFFYHVTSRDQDRRYVMPGGSDRRFLLADTAVLELLSTPGTWYLEVQGSDAAWKLTTRLTPPVSDWVMEAGSNE